MAIYQGSTTLIFKLWTTTKITMECFVCLWNDNLSVPQGQYHILGAQQVLVRSSKPSSTTLRSPMVLESIFSPLSLNTCVEFTPSLWCKFTGYELCKLNCAYITTIVMTNVRSNLWIQMSLSTHLQVFNLYLTDELIASRFCGSPH